MKKTCKRIVSLVLVFVMMFAFSANVVAAGSGRVSVDEMISKARAHGIITRDTAKYGSAFTYGLIRVDTDSDFYAFTEPNGEVHCNISAFYYRTGTNNNILASMECDVAAFPAMAINLYLYSSSGSTLDSDRQSFSNTTDCYAAVEYERAAGQTGRGNFGLMINSNGTMRTKALTVNCD